MLDPVTKSGLIRFLSKKEEAFLQRLLDTGRGIDGAPIRMGNRKAIEEQIGNLRELYAEYELTES